nr:uncharacterized protein LOC129157495 [Nothobranchius furzeri]
MVLIPCNISLSALGQAVVAPQVCSKPRETTETVLNPAPSMSGDTDPQEGVDNKKANRRSTDATFPDLCGPPCEALTKPENILASRSSWCFVPHPGQQQLLNYVLDISRPKDELIVETSSGCLTRADFWTLGLNKEMESTIANGCFELITKIVQSKGIRIYIGNLYVTRTWLAPYGCDPLQSFPTDAQRMDTLSGHLLISSCVNLAVKLIRGQWSEKNSFDLKELWQAICTLERGSQSCA